MIVEVGEKLHIIYRTLHDKSSRRHFLGEVISAAGTICRLGGYEFVYEGQSSSYLK